MYMSLAIDDFQIKVLLPRSQWNQPTESLICQSKHLSWLPKFAGQKCGEKHPDKVNVK